jgi:NAD(P)-dependent dehydrogenase (short-subunit alcohol dehydrogenase family)
MESSAQTTSQVVAWAVVGTTGYTGVRMPTRVLVTAGASGIGLAIARAFHATGASVFICDIDAAAMARAASGMPGLHTRRCDVGDRAAVADMVADAAAKLGGIDVLVNNAGIGGPTKPIQRDRIYYFS